MPGFDKSLDKEMFSESVTVGRSKLTVAIFAYNNGTPKLQLSRENVGAEGDANFAKLGRLTKEELEAILPLVEKARTKL